jgi:hypothetical protein
MLMHPRPACAAAARSVELSQSFIITAVQDLEPSYIAAAGKTQTPCQYAVDRTVAVGGKRMSMVVTAHWFGGQGGIHGYGLKDLTQPSLFVSPTPDLLARWKVGLQVSRWRTAGQPGPLRAQQPGATLPCGVWGARGTSTGSLPLRVPGV